MALGEYRPPNQISNDEDKYWKLTKTQLVYVGMGLMFGFLVFSLMSLTGIMLLKVFGAVVLLASAVAGGFIGGFTIPLGKYLKGGGLRLDVYLFRMAKKKYSRRRHVVYCANIDRDRQKVPYLSGKKEEGQEEGGTAPTLFETFKEMFGGLSDD